MAEGKEIATKIRSEAEAKKTIILAEAYSAAQKAKGEGDADAIKIYNEPTALANYLKSICDNHQ